MKLLAAACEMVVSDPEILSGTPVIRGTRIPVHDVAASVAAGHSLDRILTAYPLLDAEKVELATIYAKAHPAQTHPKSNGGDGRGMVLIADRQVSRR